MLKDAASAAIYGARGGNGVILVTTKKGSAGAPPQITYETYYGIQEPWKYMALLNAEEYGILMNESRVAAGRTLSGTYAETVRVVGLARAGTTSDTHSNRARTRMNSACDASRERLRSGRNHASTAIAAMRQITNARSRPGRPV